MNAPSYDIATLLQDSEIGLTFATDLFIASEPANPDNVVTIYDTGGAPPVVFLDNDYEYGYPAIQVRVRNNDYVEGYSLGKQIMGFLHGRADTVNGTLYTAIIATTSPFLLEYDENRRAVFIINFNLQRR